MPATDLQRFPLPIGILNMNHRDQWRPSKYVYQRGKLKASRDRKEVGVASRLIVDAVAARYDQALKQHAAGKLLDLGCGKVPLYEAYRGHVTDNICVDWENTPHKNEYLDLQCDLTATLPFADGEFDTIILSDVLEHLPQPEKLWKEISRLLSANGKILMNVPFYYWIHEQPYDYYRYTRFALQRFVQEAGLTLLQLETVGGSPEILADLLAKHVQFVPLIGPSLAILIQSATGLFVRTSFGKKISTKTSEWFPLGYFLVAQKKAA